jgi:diphosphomevalonate decarboxylase
VFGGYVILRAGAEAAEPLGDGRVFPLALTVAVTTRGEKSVGSSEGMRRTQQTSPFYSAWVESAPELFEKALNALAARDLLALGTVTERSALSMHACMIAADPPILYWVPATLRVIRCVQDLRSTGVAAFFTMDAGPHVKVISALADQARVATALRAVRGVEQVIECTAGPGAALLVDEGPLGKEDKA